jgi:hypothetical protein
VLEMEVYGSGASEHYSRLDMTPCRLVYRYRSFGLTIRWRQQDGCSTEVLVPTYRFTLGHIPEDGNLMYSPFSALLLLYRMPDLNKSNYFKCSKFGTICYSGLYWLPPVHFSTTQNKNITLQSQGITFTTDYMQNYAQKT